MKTYLFKFDNNNTFFIIIINMECSNLDNYFAKKCLEHRELEAIREKSDGLTVFLTILIVFITYIYSLFNYN